MVKVKVEIDRISRDEPDHDVVVGVTVIETNRNGDLLLYKGEQFPSVGYTSGVWLTFEVMREEDA